MFGMRPERCREHVGKQTEGAEVENQEPKEKLRLIMVYRSLGSLEPGIMEVRISSQGVGLPTRWGGLARNLL